jgi:hypothetical protein
MNTLSAIESIVDDFTRHKLFGTIELVFKAGRLVFARRTETFITASDEKNSQALPRGANGADNREFPKVRS